jgi:hypothetical protein
MKGEVVDWPWEAQEKWMEGGRQDLCVFYSGNNKIEREGYVTHGVGGI